MASSKKAVTRTLVNKRPTAPAQKAVVAPRKPRTVIGAAIQKRYVSRREAATYLGFSIKHLITLIKSGQLPEHDFGPFMKRYKLEDLEAYAAAHRQEALAESAA